jgi:hypothetical protein
MPELVPTLAQVVAEVESLSDFFDVHNTDPTKGPSTSDQRSWVAAGTAEPILIAYLERVGRPTFDRAAFDLLFDEVEAAATSPSTAFAVQAPLTCLRVREGPIELLPGVQFREPSPTDRENWINDPSAPLPTSELLDLTAVLETAYDDPKTETTNREARRVQELVGRLVTSLQLALDCDAHPAQLRFRRVHVVGKRGGFSIGAASRHGKHTADLRPGDRVAIVALYHALTRSPNLEQCAIALRRWESLSSGATNDDAIVDAWVGLESLLFRGPSSGEISYRVSLRLAALIGRDADDRRKLFREIRRRGYDARSKVLHGSDTSGLDLATLAGEARGYLRRALIAVLLMQAVFDPENIELELVAQGTVHA